MLSDVCRELTSFPAASGRTASYMRERKGRRGDAGRRGQFLRKPITRRFHVSTSFCRNSADGNRAVRIISNVRTDKRRVIEGAQEGRDEAVGHQLGFGRGHHISGHRSRGRKENRSRPALSHENR